MDTLPPELLVYISAFLGAEDLLAFMLAHRVVRAYYTGHEVQWRKFAGLIKGPLSTRFLWLAAADRTIALRITTSDAAMVHEEALAFLVLAATRAPVQLAGRTVRRLSDRQRTLLLGRVRGSNPVSLASLGFAIDELAANTQYRAPHAMGDPGPQKVAAKLASAYLRAGKLASAANVGWKMNGFVAAGQPFYKVLRVEGGIDDVRTLGATHLCTLLARGRLPAGAGPVILEKLEELVDAIAAPGFAPLRLPAAITLCGLTVAPPDLLGRFIRLVAARTPAVFPCPMTFMSDTAGTLPREQLTGAVPAVFEHLRICAFPTSVRGFLRAAGTPMSREGLVGCGVSRLCAARFFAERGAYFELTGADVVALLAERYAGLGVRHINSLPRALVQDTINALVQNPTTAGNVPLVLERFAPTAQLVAAYIRARQDTDVVNAMAERVLGREPVLGRNDREVIASALAETEPFYPRVRALM